MNKSNFTYYKDMMVEIAGRHIMKLNIVNYNVGFIISIILVKKSYLLINYTTSSSNNFDILIFLVPRYDMRIKINCHLKLKESILCSR